MSNPESPNPWLLRLRRPSAPRLRLFCLPYAGGSAGIYRDWPGHFPDDVEVCPVRLPGREARIAEAPFREVGALVEALAVGMRPTLDRPFVLFGHSMGAGVSFELARRLRREGAAFPALVILSGARAPERPNPDPPVRHLSDAEFIDEVRRRYDAIPGAILENDELIQLLLPALRADFELVETYEAAPEPPLGCPILCLGGTEDDRVSREDLEAWAVHTSAGFELRMFPGGHFFLHGAQAAVVSCVAERLASMAGAPTA